MPGNNHSLSSRKGSSPILERKWSFLGLTLFVFLSSFIVLGFFDLVPNSTTLTDTASATGPIASATAKVPGEFPTKIQIPSINLVASVANPTTADPAVLDQNLLVGAVRYPTSGLLGTPGANVVMFGHSSYLPVVHNQAFKTFDGIQNLKTGDQILVTGKDRVYIYAVETVASASAKKDGIPLSVSGNKLTLVTCDSFASKSDRFVVIAKLVGSYPVTN
ncbi:MAG: sortase [Patescibacteria group bacterium]